MVNKKKPVPALKRQQGVQKSPAEVVPPKAQPVAHIHTTRAKAAPTKSLDFAFGKMNYILMIAGLLLMAIGFILMIGGGSKDPKVFNPAIFDAQRLTVSPIFILVGFAVEIVAILRKPGN